jgi:hypothetical protein
VFDGINPSTVCISGEATDLHASCDWNNINRNHPAAPLTIAASRFGRQWHFLRIHRFYCDTRPPYRISCYPFRLTYPPFFSQHISHSFILQDTEYTACFNAYCIIELASPLPTRLGIIPSLMKILFSTTALFFSAPMTARDPPGQLRRVTTDISFHSH